MLASDLRRPKQIVAAASFKGRGRLQRCGAFIGKVLRSATGRALPGARMKFPPRTCGRAHTLEKLPKGHRRRVALLKDLTSAMCRDGGYAVTTLCNSPKMAIWQVGRRRRRRPAVCWRSTRELFRFSALAHHRSFS
jgi:hypothetical protein